MKGVGTGDKCHSSQVNWHILGTDLMLGIREMLGDLMALKVLPWVVCEWSNY